MAAEWFPLCVFYPPLLPSLTASNTFIKALVHPTAN